MSAPIDVLIVGAGPAGSVAALVLARAGVKVRLVDRARFPREKLCGDTINPGVLSILDRLGVAEAVRHRAVAITGMTVTGPGSASIRADYPDGLKGAAITRRELDLMLVEAAARAGAQVEAGVMVRAPLVGEEHRLTGVRVAAGSSDHDLFARVILAADGRHSKLAFHLGLAKFAEAPKRWAFGAYFIDVDGMSSHGEMHIRNDGYIGLAPLGGGVTNVCVVRELSGFRAQRIEPEAVVGEAVKSDPMLRERFVRARQVSDVVSLGPLAVDARSAGARGLLLAGDAAGFIDPMTGDGLRFAMRGGELAAEAALRELASGEAAHHSLAVARQREFGAKWRLNRSLRSLASSPRRLRTAAAVASWWSGPFERLIAIVSDCAIAQPLPPVE